VEIRDHIAKQIFMQRQISVATAAAEAQMMA
jgi:hypothetical protein